MNTMASARLSEDVYKNYETAKHTFDASLKDDAAKAELLAAEAVLAVELLAFAKRVVYAQYGQRINGCDFEAIIEDAGTHVWQQICRPESIGNGSAGYTGKNGCSFSSWAWTVVKHFVLAQVKSSRTVSEPNDLFLQDKLRDSAPNPYKCAERSQTISSLSDKQQRLYALKEEGYTGHEIAKKKSVADSTVDYQWKRVREKIRAA
jgi:DNA-directed RNA polymerase specialized sigma24 family protein